jgi:hypothetical protein
MQYCQTRCFSLPCFLTFHLPSPKTFNPVESITKWTISPGFFKGDAEGDFARLLAQEYSGQRSGSFIKAKMELMNPCAV